MLLSGPCTLDKYRGHKEGLKPREAGLACHQAALFVLISYQIVSHSATGPGQNFKIQRVAVIGAESAQDDPHSKNLNRSGDLKHYTL